MRFGGYNVLAIVVAAAAVYALGVVVYGVAFSDYWKALTGYRAEDYLGLEWRMALSPVMPIVMAIGTAVVLNWRGARGPMAGLGVGFLMWLFFTATSRLYGYVYGPEPDALLALDQAHLLGGHLIAGLILASWR